MKVEMYAALKEYFGPEVFLTSTVQSPEEIVRQLMIMKPLAGTILKSCRFAINDRFVNSTYKLTDTDVVSLIPPSSGG